METIKFSPYKGQDEEIYKGYKTKVTLFEDRLEYKLNFTQKVTIEFVKDSEVQSHKEADHFVDEEGWFLKSSITGISKYIETEYHKISGEPINVNYVDITYKGSILKFSCSTAEEKDSLYKTISNWKLNITE